MKNLIQFFSQSKPNYLAHLLISTITHIQPPSLYSFHHLILYPPVVSHSLTQKLPKQLSYTKSFIITISYTLSLPDIIPHVHLLHQISPSIADSISTIHFQIDPHTSKLEELAFEYKWKSSSGDLWQVDFQGFNLGFRVEQVRLVFRV